jgi:hypothetical protein
MDKIEKLCNEISELKKELKNQNELREKVQLLEELIESLTRELVAVKYQAMALAKKLIGDNWKEFIETLNREIPDYIYEQAIQENKDMCTAKRMINGIFKDKKQHN